MVEKFVAKIIEQSLDELRFKNLAVIAPLSATKIDNICRSIFGSNQTVVDFDAVNSAADLCVSFVNAKEDGVLVLKNFSSFDRDKVRFLSQALSERKFSLVHDENVVDIPLAPVPIVLLLGDRRDLDEEVARYFNFWIDISSLDLPIPISADEDSENIEQHDSSGDDDDEGHFITEWQIGEWQDCERTPVINADLARIREVMDSPMGGDVMLPICYAYLRYVEKSSHRDVLKQRLDILCKKNGVYEDRLFDLCNEKNRDWERPEVSRDEFLADDEDPLSFGDLLFDIDRNGTVEEKKLLLARMLTLINAEQGSEQEDVDLSSIEADTQDDQHIARLLKRACWKLKLGDEFDPDCDDDDLTDEPSSEVVISLGIDDFNRSEIADTKLYFEVPEGDAKTHEHLRAISERQSHKSFCYLIYHMICVDDGDRTGRAFRYYEKSDRMISDIHYRHMLAEYRITVKAITVDGQRYEIPERCTEYEWFSIMEAFPNPGGLMKIETGYGDYEAALAEIESAGEE
jgi:hypothetical protein